MKKVLVTGAFGYLGSRISARLLSENCDVIGTTRRQSGNDLESNGFEVITVDWTDHFVARQALKGVDSVIHCAGPNSRECVASPYQSYIDMRNMALSLGKAAEEAGVETVIVLSTAHVYSSYLSGRIDEGTQPVNEHPYAKSRLVGEEIITSSWPRKTFRPVVLRLANCFGRPALGPSDLWSLAVNDFCRQAVEQDAIVVKSRADVFRNFVAIQRLEDILIRALDDTLFPPFVNVGDRNLRISEVAHIIKETFHDITQREVEVRYHFEDLDDPRENLQFTSNVAQISDIPSSFDVELERLLQYCLMSFG